MSIASYQASLKSKHELLDVEIETEMLRPKPDTVHLQQLKKKKLEIKQAITAA